MVGRPRSLCNFLKLFLVVFLCCHFFGVFCCCKCFYHRTESDLFLFLLHMLSKSSHIIFHTNNPVDQILNREMIQVKRKPSNKRYWCFLRVVVYDVTWSGPGSDDSISQSRGGHAYYVEVKVSRRINFPVNGYVIFLLSFFYPSTYIKK